MTRELRGDEEKMSMLETLCVKAKESISEVEDGMDRYEVDDTGIFLVDNDIEGTSNEIAAYIPKLFQNSLNLAKPPRPSKLSSVRSTPYASLPPLYKDTEVHIENDAKSNGKAAVGTVQGMSFSVQNRSGGGGVDLGDMKESKWEMFLESFVKL
ncbi:hypothetical protein ES319_A13G000700v1 [Gossypium barbadense]|nr:hypothetical protein ES319_A13G000700v1 [Gossypium barbadense]